MRDDEEHEGFLAGKNGQRISHNPHPSGTIRYLSWRRGWHRARWRPGDEEYEGYEAAGKGLRLTDNPHPPGTIRFDGWRRGWASYRDGHPRGCSEDADTRSEAGGGGTGI